MKFVKITIILVAIFCALSKQAQGVELEVQHSIQVSFDSESKNAYRVLSMTIADFTNANLTGTTGFNTDQEGIVFNNRTMQDGTVRAD